MIWMEILRLKKLFFVEPKANVYSKYNQNKFLKHIMKKSKRFYPRKNFVFHKDSAPSHPAKSIIKWLKD